MASVVQDTHCAFSRSCINTHAKHARVDGTNKIMCAPHLAMMKTPTPSMVNGTEFASSSYRGPSTRRRRSTWSLYVGVTEGC